MHLTFTLIQKQVICHGLKQPTTKWQTTRKRWSRLASQLSAFEMQVAKMLTKKDDETVDAKSLSLVAKEEMTPLDIER